MIDSAILHTAGWVVPAAGGGLTLASFSTARWWKEKKAKDERARRAREAAQHQADEALARERRRLPDGTVLLRPAQQILAPVKGAGQLLSADFGTYGARQGLRGKQAGVRAGGVHHYSICYLCEMDQIERDRALGAWPAELSESSGKLLVCRSNLFPSGLQNATFSEVWENRRYWLQQIQEDARRTVSLGIRGTPTPEPERAPNFPAVCLVHAGSGGHAAFGIPFVAEIKRRTTDTRVYVFTVLPEDRALRAEVPTMIEAYREHNLVDGFFVVDTLAGQTPIHDLGTAIFQAGLIGGAWLGDQPVPGWNLLAQLFRNQRGGIATLSTVMTPLTVYCRDTVSPPFYYTFRDQVQVAGVDSVAAVQEEQYHALPISRPDPDSRQFIYFAAPLVPNELRTVADHIDASLELDRAKFKLNYLSLGVNLTPQSKETHATAVMATLLENGLDELKRFVSRERAAAITAPPSNNGQHIANPKQVKAAYGWINPAPTKTAG